MRRFSAKAEDHDLRVAIRSEQADGVSKADAVFSLAWVDVQAVPAELLYVRFYLDERISHDLSYNAQAQPTFCRSEAEAKRSAGAPC